MGLRWGPSCFGLEGYFTSLISGPLPAGPYRQRCEKADFRATTIRPVSETTERMKDAETQWFKKNYWESQPNPLAARPSAGDRPMLTNLFVWPRVYPGIASRDGLPASK